MESTWRHSFVKMDAASLSHSEGAGEQRTAEVIFYGALKVRGRRAGTHRDGAYNLRDTSY